VYPRNIVCFRYIIVNTLHKGDNNDDDDDDNNNNNNNKHMPKPVYEEGDVTVL
jgi:hypothetical protein